MKAIIRIIILAAMSGPVLFSCKQKTVSEKKSDKEDKLLAQVFDYKLHQSDIEDLIQNPGNSADSIQQVRSLTEHWVRDRLVLVEAEKKFPEEANLAKLLEDYRQSLIRHFFEQQVLEQMLDTVITESDLAEYYESHKEQHKLESGIWRGYFFKIRKPTQRNDKLRTWWKSFPESHRDDVLTYAANHAKTNISDTMDWHEMQLVIQLFPEGTLSPSSIRSKRGILKEDTDFVYLLYPVEAYGPHEIAPLSFIREQSARYIIHQRELAILDQIKKDIYDRDMQNERVKIFVE